MLSTTPQRVLAIVTQLMRDLHRKANAPCDLPTSVPENTSCSESDVPDEIQQQVKATMEQMRVDHLPNKFGEGIKRLVEDSANHVELSVSRISDKEVVQIVEAFKSSSTLTSLDLSHNEITDIGVQALVTGLAMGGAKNLKELKICRNQYGVMGRNMLAGLQAMRKTMKLYYDQE